MKLTQIYRPIEKELIEVEEVLRSSLRSSRYKSILEINNYLLGSPGKRLRPALVLLSAKASQGQSTISRQSTSFIAAAVELIHVASLIHDDVIDKASLRHNRPTINSRWGQDVSIALGDYLYSLAFELISRCGNADILECISSATKAMCEGELIQVCERDNFDLLQKRYIIIVKKKTASLFAASCEIGSLISGNQKPLQSVLKQYGLNFGITFQIIDDYLDLVGKEETTGKPTGQDIASGEMTLPLLNLCRYITKDEREKLKLPSSFSEKDKYLGWIREKLLETPAALKTKETARSYIALAKEKINILPASVYKQSLLGLADFIMERGFKN